jgi:beta-glucosidase
LISDYYAIGQIDADYKTAVMTSINAGMDMAWSLRAMRASLRRCVRWSREVAQLARIDDARHADPAREGGDGLLDTRRCRFRIRTWREFGSTKHREVARRAVRESLVLLKNETTRRLSRRARRGFTSAGGRRHRHAVRRTSPGRAPGNVTTGTTLRAAIVATDRPRTSDHSAEAGADGADVAVVVVGEAPYAEGMGIAPTSRSRPATSRSSTRSRRRTCQSFSSSTRAGR